MMQCFHMLRALLCALLMNLLVCLLVASASDIEPRGFYRNSEFVPGLNEAARWDFVVKHLPTLIGKTDAEVETLFGVSTVPVSRIRRGERWDHPEWRTDDFNKDYIYGISETKTGDTKHCVEIAIVTHRGLVEKVSINSYNGTRRPSFGIDEPYPAPTGSGIR
jgi:hypothetical protein